MTGWLNGNLVSVVDGVAFGLLLFTIAVGLSLVFGMMDVLNLAHGTLYLAGAYVAYALSDGSLWGLVLALAAGALVGGMGGAALTFLTRPLARRGHLDQAVLTLGITFIVADLLAAAFGGEVLPTDPPTALRGTVSLVGHAYPVYRLVFIGVAAALALLVHLVFERSSLGALVRAAVADRDMVRALGSTSARCCTGSSPPARPWRWSAVFSGRRFWAPGRASTRPCSSSRSSSWSWAASDPCAEHSPERSS